MENQQQKKKQKELQQENEELKEIVPDEFGLLNSNTEIFNMQLESVLNFQKTFMEAQRITLYQFIGSPVYRKLQDLQKDEIKAELESIMKVLDDKKVILDTLTEVDERELYRFITEELFLLKVVYMPANEMFTVFNYEDFYPNHAYDLSKSARDFFDNYLDKSTTSYFYNLSSRAEKALWHTHFRDSFSDFTCNQMEVTAITFDTKTACVLVQCDFVAHVENDIRVILFSGEATLHFVKECGYWYVDSLVLPMPTVS